MELGRMGVRRLWVLMNHLPEGAWLALMRERGTKRKSSSLRDFVRRVKGGK